MSQPINETNGGVKVQHNTKKGFNAAAKDQRRNPRLFHILFIRHAESSNNVLAEEITRELGINPYGPNAGTQVLDEYDRRRLCDPHLSPLGEKQAKLLPIHPHLKDINITALAAEARVRVVTSPMKRAILTSIPLLTSYNLPRALLVADMCEKGGSYVTHKEPAGPDGQPGKHENRANPGLGREELERLYGTTHDSRDLREDGWWHTPCSGAEDSDAFEQRLIRARSWIEGQVTEYSKNPLETPDYMLIVSHADFIDAILTKLLDIKPRVRYVFYSSNTSISHVEFEIQSSDDQGQSPPPPPGVRIRGTNIKPVDVSAHELPIQHEQQH